MNESSGFDDEDDVTPGGADALSPAALFPWPPGENESAIDAFVQTWKGASLHPSRFYSTMPPEARMGPAVLYYLIVGIVVAAINLFWRFILPRAEIDTETVPTAMAIAQSISPLVEFLMSPIVQVIGLFIGAAITHVMILILTTERGSYGRTVRVFAYAYSPALVLVAIPYVGSFVAGVWSLVIAIIGLREAHRTTTGRAVMAVLLPAVFVMIIGIVLAMLVVAGGLMMVE